MDYIGISQTIGRVIRLGDATKTFGLVCIPVYSKVGISTARKVEAVVDTVLNHCQSLTINQMDILLITVEPLD